MLARANHLITAAQMYDCREHRSFIQRRRRTEDVGPVHTADLFVHRHHSHSYEVLGITTGYFRDEGHITI